MILNGQTIKNGQDIVNSFASFFSSVYADKDLVSEEYNMPYYNLITKSDKFNIKELDIINAMKNINYETSPGPDKIHPYFVKNTQF